MARTSSRDYKLPSRLQIAAGNLALEVAPLVPRGLADRFLARHGYYQRFALASFSRHSDDDQGESERKWQSLDMPPSVTGSSVLDIGCAEGYFCLESARRGAGSVMGIDARLGTLLTARLLALREGLPVQYRIGIFPDVRLARSFDYVLCLSVLHHLVSTKDIWQVLSSARYRQDLERMRGCLTSLRTLTAPGGRCIIEMHYEYETQDSRHAVDFERFNAELLAAGFASARTVGGWEHAERNRERKDRIVYVADAPRR